ncbi:MAG TPA: transglycosylase domain-containing protein, partial [Anaerolineales bacterium]|nr:transglycosylase domain-containing protein [Anaerolineales bacterium]
MQNKPTPEKIISWRQSRRHKKQTGALSTLKKVGVVLLALFSLVLLAAIGIGAYTYSSITATLPSIEILPDLLSPRGQFRHATRLYDRTGQTLLVALENPNAAQAEYLFLELIPEDLVNATLVMRDPTFWDHSGFIINGENPTLAEQLVEELLLWQEPESWQKTWQTHLLAAQITESYGREQILEWYLNNASYGELAYGVDEAAWVYFNKPADELSLAEAATLGAVVGAPALNPIAAEQVAIERQGKTLNAMLAAGVITTDEAVSANRQAIPIQTSALPLPMLAPEFTNLALEDLYQEIGQLQAERGGFVVLTSLDLELQAQVECTLAVQIARLEGRLPHNSLGGVACPSAALLPTLGQNFTPSNTLYDAGAVVMEPQTAEVLALSGSANIHHEAGTILSPYIYLTAFTRGLSPASQVWDIPASTPPGLEEYANFDDTYHGPMRIRTASAHDHLIPILSTLRQIGPNNAWRTIQQSGLYSLEIPNEDEYSPLLSSGQFSLLEMTHGYSLFANQGNLAGNLSEDQGTVKPITILNITDTNQRVWLDTEPQNKPVTTPQLAYLITDMLSDEQARSDSIGHPNPYEIGRPAAVKWGQPVLNGSAWSVGYTPDRVTGIWIGPSDPSAPNSAESIEQLAAAGLWHALMKTAHTDLAISDWSEPVGITHKVVCDPSGLLPTTECPDTVSEVFIVGSEPVQTDNLYQTFQVNSETNRLATIYTPPEFLEERVYLVVPPQAETWALQSGMEIPPDTYDV